MAAPTTGPSVPPATPARTHEQEDVETRARAHELEKEEKRNVQPPTDAQPLPNYLRPCVGLDVHKGSITATQMDPGGKVVRTWTLPTTRTEVLSLAESIPPKVPVVLEASTAGKAVAMVLNDAGRELHMAAPNKIPKPQVKTDKRDSVRLAQLYQSGSMPECYVPSAEIEHLRLLTRNRKDLAYKVTLVKNQVRALVTRNLLDSEMKGVSKWFGPTGLRKLTRLPLASEDRAHLARHLEQLELLAQQEEAMQVEMAHVGRSRKDVQLLMTVPGISFYAAIGIIAEIGDVKRFADKQHLASYAGLVPKANNSGEHVGEHQPLKTGNTVLKSFLCGATSSMIKSHQETAVNQFYREKTKSRPAQLALVAAARKLTGEIWRILTYEVPYREQDASLTGVKERKMLRLSEEPAPTVTVQDLDALADRLTGKEQVLDRLQEEAGEADEEGDDVG